LDYVWLLLCHYSRLIMNMVMEEITMKNVVVMKKVTMIIIIMSGITMTMIEVMGVIYIQTVLGHLHILMGIV
jgi:hypothetical protein